MAFIFSHLLLMCLSSCLPLQREIRDVGHWACTIFIVSSSGFATLNSIVFQFIMSLLPGPLSMLASPQKSGLQTLELSNTRVVRAIRQPFSLRVSPRAPLSCSPIQSSSLLMSRCGLHTLRDCASLYGQTRPILSSDCFEKCAFSKG